MLDGLEAKVGELEATQFSTTTKLKGGIFIVGGVANEANDSNEAVNFRTIIASA